MGQMDVEQGNCCGKVDRVLEPAICCWCDLIVGKACCVYNIIFSPFVLCFWSVWIYLCGCLSVLCRRCCLHYCCCLCRWCKCCWMYTDKKFPPEAQSLGEVGGDNARTDSSGQHSMEATWIRAGDFAQSDQGNTMQLFGSKIDVRDICQGALGDCWLLAAMACLAEHEGAIPSLFTSREYDPRGKYKIRLFDGVKNEWELLVLDDYIPCDANAHAQGETRPLFLQPNGNMLWAILLEKAFAKFCGSFAALEGGSTIWALRAMTGDHARTWERKLGASGEIGYSRLDLKNVEDPKDRRKSKLMVSNEEKNSDEMFTILKKYHQYGSVLCASGASGEGGLAKGHAYSILRVCKVKAQKGSEEQRMVQIRNPWGTGEWKGAWRDSHENWTKFPEVAKAVGYKAANDGAFWMSWNDFIKNWEHIGVVDRTIDISTLRYKVDSTSNYPATKGCLNGCSLFWCRCWGCRRLYCPHRSSMETIRSKQRCWSCKRRVMAS